MIPVLRAAQVREIDAYNASLGMSEAVLMQNFAYAIRDELARFAPEAKRFCILCGPGNNGGDGYALARLLHARGLHVTVLALYAVRSTTARIYAEACEREGICVEQECGRTLLDTADVIVDAVFGIGLTRPVEGVAQETIEAANASAAKRVAIDVPSGLDDDGRALGTVFCADLTVTAVGYKYSLLFGQGRAYAGEIAVKDILAAMPPIRCAEYVAECPPSHRPKACHKGSFADVWIVGGSHAYVGAGLIAHEAAEAALRSGAGLVRLCVAESDHALFAARIKEGMLVTLPSRKGLLVCEPSVLDTLIPDGAVVAIGMGLGRNPEVGRMTSHLLRHRALTLIIDADGINTFADTEGLRGTQCRVVFTPHIKEFSRLTGKPVDEILRDPVRHAEQFAAEYGCCVLLKSDVCIATDGERTFVTASGSPAQAKAGSGDTLAGVVAALCGEFEPIRAAIYGAALCGTTATRLADELGERAVLASDVIKEIKKHT